MTYEAFVAYSVLAVIALLIALYFRWLYTIDRDRRHFRQRYQAKSRNIKATHRNTRI